MTRAEIFEAINAERARQVAKFGDLAICGNLPDTFRACILTEEVGEVAKSLIDGDTANLRDELVQVAAVAVGWLEAMG